MKASDIAKNKSVRLGGSMLGVLALIWVLRVMHHSPTTEATPSPEPEPEPVELVEIEPEPVEPEPEPPSAPDIIQSEERFQANIVWDAIRRHVYAYAWELSKLPKDELNELCWQYRPQVQALKEQFNGGDRIIPSEFAGNESVLLGDAVCRMARHYQQTGDAPQWASTDISTLEGLVDEAE